KSPWTQLDAVLDWLKQNQPVLYKKIQAPIRFRGHRNGVHLRSLIQKIYADYTPFGFTMWERPHGNRRFEFRSERSRDAIQETADYIVDKVREAAERAEPGTEKRRLKGLSRRLRALPLAETPVYNWMARLKTRGPNKQHVIETRVRALYAMEFFERM